jgi:hypothetical protein
MAVIFAEQTETGSVAWMSDSTGMAALSTTTAGSWSTYCLHATTNDVGQALWNASASEFWGQFRVYFDQGADTGHDLRFYSVNGTVNVEIGWTAAGLLIVNRGAGTTLLATGTTVFAADRWYYVQFHFKIHDTTGEVHIKIDNTDETLTFVTGTATTQDTRNDAAANGDTCNRIDFRNGEAAKDLFIDDMVINDNTDTDNVSYPDNIGIEALMPSAAGDNTGLSRGGSDSGANWSQTEERPPNDATDYVFDSVVNDYDLYSIPSTQWTTVAAVVVPLRCQKSDAGAANIAHMVKYDTDASGTADTENTGSDIALSTSWTYHTKYYNRQPGPTSWTAAKVNALQVGAKVR